MAIEHRAHLRGLLAELGVKGSVVHGAELDAQLLALLLQSFAAAYHIYDEITVTIAKATDTADPRDPLVRIHWLSKPRMEE